MKILVTGAAGFIGSQLADTLLARGDEVIGYDNLSTGTEDNLSRALSQVSFRLCVADLLDLDRLKHEMKGCDAVFHLAANADVRFGTEHPRRDLEQNTIATWNVVEAMRTAGVKQIAFSSTGSVYGEPEVFPTPETCPFPRQTSLYGASKVAAEALISAYSEGFGLRALIFRFVSILGPRYSHGHVIDFYRQLREHPDRLFILGNGHQRKSYLHVGDCVRAMLLAFSQAGDGASVYNLGTDEFCEVNDSVAWICEALGLDPVREYAGGERGWVGDSPLILLDCQKIRSLGWSPRMSIREAILDTVQFLATRESAGAVSALPMQR